MNEVKEWKALRCQMLAAATTHEAASTSKSSDTKEAFRIFLRRAVMEV